MEVKLVVVAGEAPAAEYSVQLPASIGRSRMADIKVGHPLVSRKHCELFAADDGMLMIRDLGSLNGTFVGDTRIGQPTPLPPGAVLTVGAVTFQAVYGDMPPDTTDLQLPAGESQGTFDAASVEQTLEFGESESPVTEPVAAEGDGGFNFNWLEDPAENEEAEGGEQAVVAPVVAEVETEMTSDTDSLELPGPVEEAVEEPVAEAENEFAPPDEPAAESSDEDDDLSDFLASLK